MHGRFLSWLGLGVCGTLLLAGGCQSGAEAPAKSGAAAPPVTATGGVSDAASLLLAPRLPEWKNIGPGGGGWIQSMCASPHQRDTLLVGCDVGGFYLSTDAGTSYRIFNEGLQDYFVECIAPHPTDPRTIYLGCESGMYKSTDGGRAWCWLREGFPPKQGYSWSAPIGALVIDAANPETVYAGIGRSRWRKSGRGAVYKTADGGAHWAKVNATGSIPDDAWITDLIIDPGDSRHLYLACQRGVFQSRDAGVTWQLTANGLPHPCVRRLAVCRAKPNVLYVTLESEPAKEPWQGGVYKSTDAGQTWQACLNGLRQQVGKPGQPAPMTANYDRIVAHPENPDIAYVGGCSWVNAMVYKTVDGGQSWGETIKPGEGGNFDRGWIKMWGPSVECLTLSPLAPDTLYFGTSGHIFKTTDGAKTWEQAYCRMQPDGRFSGTGLEVTCLHNIIVHPRNSQTLFFGYYDIGLLMSEDGGQTFKRCMDGIDNKFSNSCFAIAFDPADPAHCWGGFGSWGANEGVVAESLDGGKTWRQIGMPETGLPKARCRKLLVDGASALGAVTLLAACDTQGVFASVDSGKTWQARNQGLPHGDVRALVAHPQTAGVYWCLLAATKELPPGLYRTEDTGQHWTALNADLPMADVKSVAVAASAPERLYLTARQGKRGETAFPGGVWRSDDAGATWRQVLSDRFAQSVAVDPRDANVVYAGMTDHPYHDECLGSGVACSRDGGVTWVSLNAPSLTCRHAGVLTLDPQRPERVYVGTGGNGVFVGDVAP